jgi:Domain of Unknown Function (DUF326)
MSYTWLMLDTFARTAKVDTDVLAAAIDAMNDCAQACTADNAADLGEPHLADMVKCIRLCLDCTDVCTAAAGVTSRLVDYDPGVLRPLLESCVAICRSCGDECERHAPRHAHCRVCAEACRRCEQACRALLAALA